jgi:hypothetical protein
MIAGNTARPPGQEGNRHMGKADDDIIPFRAGAINSRRC